MNKTAIKNFAVWARRKLISEITYKAGLIGINEKGISQPLSISTGNIQFFDIGTGKPNEITNHEIKQRNALVKRIREKESSADYQTAFQFVMEEVAYTWFNRLIAIRFMEVNDYLPSRVRVLSSETPAKIEPDMVTTPFDTDMTFLQQETDQIMQLKQENKLDELFRLLFIKQCNQLNDVLPELFEKTADYTELLLTISYTDADGIISRLVTDIPEADFTEAVEIIGWLYQYYNTEQNELVYDGSYAKNKISKDLLPAATTIYTPDWAVRYMVENSLGRLWVEGHPNDQLKTEWQYYLEEAEQEECVQAELDKIRAEYKKLNPQDIKVIDPCMGSGHILVYAFEVLMQIYKSQGYTQREAAKSIVENNLYGLDINDRAYQLGYFAVIMKGRKYDRRFLTRTVAPKLYSIKESNGINKEYIEYFGHSLNDADRNLAIQQVEYLLATFYDAKEYGSILNVEDCDWELLNNFINDYKFEGQMSLDSSDIEETQEKLTELIVIGEVMAQKYDVVVTNPPYLGSSRFSSKLDKYVKENYIDEKADLSMVMLKRAMQGYSRKNRFISFITTSSWMYLSSFEKIRNYMLNNLCIDSLIDFGTELFDGKVGHNPIVSWVNRNTHSNKKMTAIRLVDYCYSRRDEKESEFFNPNNRFTTTQNKFSIIPGKPIAYWVSEGIIDKFKYPKIENVLTTREGMATANNNLFLRFWFEISFEKSSLINNNNPKWIPYNKGGIYRKWYGNNEYLVNWENDGFEIKNNKDSATGRIRSHNYNGEYAFKEGITWSSISSGNISFRYSPPGFMFDSKGAMGFSKNVISLGIIQAFLNSTVTMKYLEFISPTMDFKVGDIIQIPFLYEEISKDTKVKISSLYDSSLQKSRIDWDAFEISWDFETHPFITFKNEANKISEVFATWSQAAEKRFNQLKANEEELNRIFIEIYGLQDELTPEVEDKDVTVRKADLQRDIKSFISYAVGCMLGRYSLDVDGLAYAGGDWDESKYTTFIPDKDNCIPITDEEYFEEDIVGRLVEFVSCVYGAEPLEENLDFIAKALGNKGNTSREIIRNYFVKDFYKNHVQTYQKRPIYWLYDSGKQNGFKALVYMHRYTADTTGIVRVDYLHKMQKIYMSEIDSMIDMAENSNNTREIAQAEKRKEKLVKQLKETKEYDEKIAHLAISRIAIDLDDGVKVNYEKVQMGQDGKKLGILGKI